MDNCIQNFHLGKYIFQKMVGNLVLIWRCANEHYEYDYPHSYTLSQHEALQAT